MTGLVRSRREPRPRPMRNFYIALAVAAIAWFLVLLWAAHDFHAAYDGKDIKWCAATKFNGVVCR